MPDQAPIPETINEIILRIINLESLDGVSYDEYYGLLLEQIALIEDDQSDLSSKEIKIIQEEAKVIGPFAKKNPDDMVNERFNVKKRAVNTDKLFKNKKKPTVKTTSKKGLIPKKVLTDSDSKNNQDILTSILGSVNNILQILQNQSSFERKVYNKNLREKEQERRESQENKLESAFSKGIAGLKSISSKVFSPFQNIIGKLINFFTWLFLGKAFQSFMKWVTNPANEKKVKFLSNLLKTFWPAILAAVILFLTPVGGLIRAITSSVIKWTLKLSKFAIPKLLKFIAKHPLAAGAIAVGAAVAGATVLGKKKEDENINRILQKEAEAEGKTLPEKQKENEQNKSWVDRFGDAFNFGNLGMGGVSPLGFSQGGTIPNIEHGYNGIDGNTGEEISGAGRDTQLIAARPGEVVLTPEDQSYIYKNTGFDIPGFVGNRRPKFINGSNLRFTNPSLFGKDNTKIPKFEAGGIVGGKSEAISLNLSDTQKNALDVLGKYESQIGGYNAVNQIGTDGGHGVSGFSGDFTKMKQHKRRPLTDLTLGEIIKLQHDDRTLNDKQWIDQGKLHAVGRYQIVGNTLPGLIEELNLPLSTKFSPVVQDAMALVLMKDRGIQPWVGPSKKATSTERAIVENARKENIKISKVKLPQKKVINSQKIGGAVYTEREGGVYTRNGVPITKDRYTKSVGSGSKNRFNPLQTIRNVASTVTGVGRPAQATSKQPSSQAGQSKSKKSNHQKLVEKRPWFDKFGWFGGASRWNKKQGGGYIGESSGINVPGMTADRQLLFSPFGPTLLKPGEFVLPDKTVTALGGQLGVEKIVEATDSNSKAALDGKVLNPISKDFGITPYKTDVEIASLPGMNMMGGPQGSGGGGQPGGSTEDFSSPISPVAGSTRATIFQILGIVA